MERIVKECFIGKRNFGLGFGSSFLLVRLTWYVAQIPKPLAQLLGRGAFVQKHGSGVGSETGFYESESCAHRIHDRLDLLLGIVGVKHGLAFKTPSALNGFHSTETPSSIFSIKLTNFFY
jgi:hypothetical protein